MEAAGRSRRASGWVSPRASEPGSGGPVAGQPNSRREVHLIARGSVCRTRATHVDRRVSDAPQSEPSRSHPGEDFRADKRPAIHRWAEVVEMAGTPAPEY